MTSIDTHKKHAKRQARKSGTSHQSELNAIAQNNGHANWGSFLSAQTSTPATTLQDLPDNPRELEEALRTTAGTIITNEFEETARKTLSALLLVETLRASQENRFPDLSKMREWFAEELNRVANTEMLERHNAEDEGKFFTCDYERDWMDGLANECHRARPYGHAYAQMKRVAAMNKTDRTNMLMEILPSLTDRIDDLQKSA